MNKCLCFALIVYSQKYAIFSKDFLYLLILFEGLNSEEKCDTWPVEKCSIKKKKVKKFIPDTKCTKTPREVCTKGGCALKEVKIMKTILNLFDQLNTNNVRDHLHVPPKSRQLCQVFQ